MIFPRALTQSDTQTTSNLIWTLVTDSISYYDNRDAVYASKYN